MTSRVEACMWHRFCDLYLPWICTADANCSAKKLADRVERLVLAKCRKAEVMIGA